MNPLETADTQPAPPLLDHEQSPTTFFDDLEGAEAGASYDASARCAIVEHDPIAEALCNETLRRMGLR